LSHFYLKYLKHHLNLRYQMKKKLQKYHLYLLFLMNLMYQKFLMNQMNH
jgi:hypothetical protein